MKLGGDWELIESAEVTRARSALVQESRFISTLLDTTGAVVVTLDENATIVRCNAACEVITGKPSSEVEGTPFWEAFRLPRQRVENRLRSCFDSDGISRFESVIQAADAREVTFSWSAGGVRDDDGNLKYIVFTGQDITEHRHTQRMLEDAYQREHRIAETLQSSLLRPVPTIPGLDLGVVYRPAIQTERVGGDFYDVYGVRADLVAVVVGDVSGKGLRAAGLTETVRSTIRALLYMGLSPAEALEGAGRVLYDQTRPEQFATVGVALVDVKTGDLEYASAGHPPPIVRGAEASFLDVRQGVPLGTFDQPYESVRTRIEPGEMLILYTDGLSEARSGDDFFSDHGLLEAVDARGEDPQAIVGGLLEEAELFSVGALQDDVVVVAVRRQ